MADTSGPGPGAGLAEEVAAGGDDGGGGSSDVGDVSKDESKDVSPDPRLSPETVDDLETSATENVLPGVAAEAVPEALAAAPPAAPPAAAPAAGAPPLASTADVPRRVNGAAPIVATAARGQGWCQGSPLERKRFFCREWVFAKLAHCLEARPASKTCGALVVGGPGTGKTALCCEAVWPAQGPTGRQQRALRRRLLAYHFCQAHDASTLSVADFIRRLVVQLQAVHETHQQQAASPPAALPPQSLSATAAAAYAEKVRTDPEIQAALQPDMLERDPDEALKRAVLFPLLELEPPRQCLFLLVDSLDETGPLEVPTPAHRTSRTIGELLANHHHLFPQWLLLVVTARRQSKAVAKMFTGFRKISLDDLRKTQVVRDVQQYILARLDREDSLKQHISRDTAEMLNQLHIKSNGCFLYLEKVLDGVADNFIVLREVREIPGTLNGLYLWLCQRLFNRKQFAKVKPLLNVLLTTRRPLTRDELSSCISTSLPNVTREYFNWRLHLLRRVLVTTGPVPAIAADPPSSTKCASASASVSVRTQPQLLLFHHSFAEWLLDVKHCTQKYLCSAAQGHAMLAMWYTMRAKYLSKEEVQTFAFHLSKLPPLPKPDKSEAATATALDPHQFQVLWLIDSGAPVENCLLPGENEDDPAEVPLPASKLDPLPTLSALPRDQVPQVLKLLLDAGAIPPPKDEDTIDKDSAMGVGVGVAEDIEKKSVGVGGDCEPPSIDDEGTSSQISEPSPASGALAELLGMLGMDRDINRADPSSGRTLLHALAAEGDSRLLELALQSYPEAELERTDRHGQTPLNLAARHGHADVVEVLLAGGARVDHADRDGWTALRAGAWGGHRQVVDLLLEAGAAVDYADMDQRTALRAAAWGGHEDIVLALLRAAPSSDHVNRTDDEGRTALIAAAYMGHAEIVEHLLEYGAEIDHADNDGRTALSVAALCVPANEGYAKVSVVNILLEKGACVDHQDKDGMTPLLVAAFEGHRDVCELLLESEADVDHADRCGRTPLWAAASMGHSTVVALLLFWGCYVDSIDNEGRTVLSVAAAQGNTEVVRQLLDRGLDEQHRDNSGWTPLHYAAFEGHREVCEALLEGGARVDEPDNDGKGALMLAAQEGHVALVQDLLVRHGAPPDQKAHDGKAALRMAALEGHYEVVRCLIQSGADVDAKDADGRSCLYILALENRLPMARFLLDQGGADVESRDSEGRTPLHVSAWQGHVEMVALLLTVGGADVNSVDLENRTALHSASWQGNASIVRLLLEHGAAPDHTCNQGATALGIAAQEGHEACVRALLQHGADPNHSDRCGRNALRVAMKSGHENVVRLLEEFAASSRPHHLRLTTNGGSSGAASITSGASAETKPSSALLIPSAPLAHHNSISPIDSPDSTSKRRSFVSLGNHSSHSKSSSNLTGSTKSSHQESNNSHQLAALSFTQQLQQCTRGGKSRPLSRLLSPLQSEPQSPIYATPPHSPLSDVGLPASPLAVTPTGGVGGILADPHFTRDTHMRIILGNSSAGVGRNVKSGSDFNYSGGSGSKAKRNGIVTNPALRLVPGLKNGLDFASGRKMNSSARVTNSSIASPAAIVNSRPNNGFQWRKETPL